MNSVVDDRRSLTHRILLVVGLARVDAVRGGGGAHELLLQPVGIDADGWRGDDGERDDDGSVVVRRGDDRGADERGADERGADEQRADEHGDDHLHE
ncbi:hypothetical protein OV090_49315 [Nannocystis sp. RBIL2]|uniref:hypothetical protein n=1 Tax=Nannocystis sp. RBIL2 TaxID=2996788 RepID=UPI00226E4804|nr:hypothetical protein [Nannocystis sp. RBIL2]MCY1068072.1 hypothetical protein [Nannocystis sp. RBIL2]MCY1072844.1 hypothetical protein [Nannocystis sp. RBIL2]